MVDPSNILSQASNILDKLTPFSRILVLLILPIYIVIGTQFAIVGKWIVDLIPITDPTNFMIAYIVGGIFIVLGIIIGIVTDPERNEKEE